MTGEAVAKQGVGSRLLGRLRRVTTSKAFIPEIDGLRFLAILTVVLFHLGTAIIDNVPAGRWLAPPDTDWLRRLTLTGGLGVDIFFAISGFVLALPFARHHLQGAKPVSLRAYYWRRVTRLEPPYILVMVGLFAVHVWLLKTGTFAALLPRLLASLVYLHCIIYGEWSKINPVAWSLETEVQFYLLAPLFAQIYRIPGKFRRRSLMIGLILASIALGQFAGETLRGLHLDRTILVYGNLFLVGFLFADIYLVDMAEEGAAQLRWDLAGIVAILGIFYLPHQGIFGVLFSFLIFCLLAAVFNGVKLRAAFRSPWVTAVGGMCYTIYLLHYAFLLLVLLATRHLAFNGPFWMNYVVQAIICLPLVFAVSSAYFLLIEKPCMYPDWPQRAIHWLMPGRSAPAQPH